MRLLSEVSKAFDVKLWFRFRMQQSLWAKSLMIKYCKRVIPGLVEIHKQDSALGRGWSESKTSLKRIVSGK